MREHVINKNSKLASAVGPPSSRIPRSQDAPSTLAAAVSASVPLGRSPCCWNAGVRSICNLLDCLTVYMQAHASVRTLVRARACVCVCVCVEKEKYSCRGGVHVP
jgi:hypothetical protein